MWICKASILWQFWRMNYGPEGFNSKRSKHVPLFATDSVARAWTSDSRTSIALPVSRMWWTVSKKTGELAPCTLKQPVWGDSHDDCESADAPAGGAARCLVGSGNL